MGLSAGDDVVRSWGLTVVRVGEIVIGRYGSRGSVGSRQQSKAQVELCGERHGWNESTSRRWAGRGN